MDSIHRDMAIPAIPAHPTLQLRQPRLKQQLVVLVVRHVCVLVIIARLAVPVVHVPGAEVVEAGGCADNTRGGGEGEGGKEAEGKERVCEEIHLVDHFEAVGG